MAEDRVGYLLQRKQKCRQAKYLFDSCFGLSVGGEVMGLIVFSPSMFRFFVALFVERRIALTSLFLLFKLRLRK